MSYAELVALQAACAKSGDPIADSMAEATNWYLTNELPGPGETKDAKKTDAAPGAEEDEVGAEADALLPDVSAGDAPVGRGAPTTPEPELKDDEINLPAAEPSERARVD